MFKLKAFTLASVFILGACATQPSTDLSFRRLSGDYKTWKSGNIEFPPLKTQTLPNGLKVYFIYDDSLPLISMSWVGRVGVHQEKPSQAGINALTAYLLEQGTQSRSAVQLNEDLAELGTGIDVQPSLEFTELSLDSLSTHRHKALELFADVLMNPAFSEKDFSRVRANMQAAVKKKIDNPGSYASESLNAWYFGSHPFARSLDGSLESLKSITRSDVLSHYQTYYRPQNSSLAITGKFDEAFEQEIVSAFSRWSANSADLKIAENFTPPEGNRVKTIKKNGLKQSEIRMSLKAIPRNHIDTIKLRLANEVLGGGFASRLNQRIRDDLGLTYSIYSSLQQSRHVGVLRVTTFTKNESVDKVIAETSQVLKDFWQSGITENELAAAKKQIVGQFPKLLETSDRIAFNIIYLENMGLDPKSLTQYVKDVEKTSLGEVNSVIKKYFAPENLYVLKLVP